MTSRGPTAAYFTLSRFKNTRLKDYKLWFPKLAVKVVENNIENLVSVTNGWNNQMNSDGKIIEEFNENMELDRNHDKKDRIVFAKYKDPLGYSAYKFVGIFKLKEIDEHGKRIYQRIYENCLLIKT
jgi:hypothetical protein